MFTVFIKFCVHICVQHILPSILIPVKQLRTVRGVVFRCVDAAVVVVARVRRATALFQRIKKQTTQIRSAQFGYLSTPVLRGISFQKRR